MITLDIIAAPKHSVSMNKEFLDDLKQSLCDKITDMYATKSSVLSDTFRLVQNGKNLTDSVDLNQTLHVELRGSLLGGKGGFGSLLRSVKPKA